MSGTSRLTEPDLDNAPGGGMAGAAAGLIATGVEAVLARRRFNDIVLDYDPVERVLFCEFAYSGRPCFTGDVLREALEAQRVARGFFGDADAAEAPVRYLVLSSRVTGVWSLGADLAFCAGLIRNRDRAGLRHYAHACCDLAFTYATGLGFDLPVISVALVQGDAIGSGFETALACNLIVAEKSARFGLPEILFNLFPGMGGLSFLARRIAPGLAERLIRSGEVYGAEQLHALGAVDVLAADGKCVAEFYDFIGPKGCGFAAQRALYRALRLVNPVNLEEMTRIADLWVEAAVALEESDLQRMLRLLAAQESRSFKSIEGNHQFAMIRSN